VGQHLLTQLSHLAEGNAAQPVLHHLGEQPFHVGYRRVEQRED
jgi:hypothetical protein